MSLAAPFPLLGFAAYSGTGKTALLTRLIPLLAGRGLRIGMIKHAHHAFDVDQPGKDSHRLRKAGARVMLISSARRSALMRELAPDEPEPGLAELLQRIDPAAVDLVLVEGFKREALPKIELCRPSLGHPYLYPEDPDIVALATDAPPPPDLALPHLDLNDPPAIADFILENIRETGNVI